MIRKIRIGLIAGALLLACAGCGGQKREIRFGTGNSGGVYYSFGNAFAEELEREDAATKYTIKETAGSAANLRLLSEGFLKLAVSQSDLTDDAWHQKGLFAEKVCNGYGVVAGLYSEPCQLIASEASGIRSVEDLAGKRVSVGEKESAVIQNAEQIMLANGLTFEMSNVQYLSFTDAADAIEKGELDAFFCTAGIPTKAVSELAEKTAIRLIPQDETRLRNLLETYRDYVPAVIPAGTYKGQTEDIATVSVRALLLASDSLSEDQVYTITKGLFTHADAIRQKTNIEIKYNPEEILDGVTTPFHPGALRWYQEQGIRIDTETEG